MFTTTNEKQKNFLFISKIVADGHVRKYFVVSNYGSFSFFQSSFWMGFWSNI